MIASNPCTLASTSVTTTWYPIFVIDPRTDRNRCLVSIEGDTHLDGGDPGSSMQSSGSGRHCIGESILSQTETPKGIGIPEVRDGTVYWIHRTSIEAATAR